MPNYRSLDDLTLQNTWLTIGIFDGVHRGHQEILGQLIQGAHAEGSPAVVLTFTPHPAILLGGKSDFKSLTTAEERTALLEGLGVDAVITLNFDQSLADQTAEEFMRHVARSLGLHRLLVGYDTALGRGRQGDAARLGEIGKELGYTVQTVPPVKTGGAIISSTRIRALVAAGEVAAAAADLGRPYAMTGAVIHGDERGRRIGIPTANLQVPAGKVIPANGVYAGWAWAAGKRYPAVTNIGIRPTFTPEEFLPHVETHLLDFRGDLYQQVLKLEFVEALRAERKFPSVEVLVAQIHADIEKAREVLK